MRTITFLLIIFIGVNLSLAQTKIISSGDEWTYYDDKDAPPEGWIDNNTLSRAWKKGASPLGYGDDDIKTVISYGDKKSKKDITKYFKKTFRIDDPYAFLVYELSIRRDDGIVIYVNGKEFLRDNMPEGEIDHQTEAVDLIMTKGEKLKHSVLLFSDDLVTGLNTISVSVHQGKSTSSDCLFDLELVGDNNPELIPLLLKERTIKNLNLDLKVKELQHEQELENKDLQIELQTRSKKNSQTWFLIVGILLFLCLMGLLYVLRMVYSKSRKLTETSAKLEEDNHIKDREMMGSSLNSLNNQQFLKELKKELETSLTSDAASMKKELRRTINQIDYNLDNEEEWINLKKHFNAIHTGFFDELVKLHPSLSEAELRHCIFIKLHMQTKEIAKILHIDPRSVQVSRYRIKKKMSLDENVDLRDYLLKL